jgi:hypothetical protein
MKWGILANRIQFCLSTKKQPGCPGCFAREKFSYLISQVAPTPSFQPKMCKKNSPVARAALQEKNPLI